MFTFILVSDMPRSTVNNLSILIKSQTKINRSRSKAIVRSKSKGTGKIVGKRRRSNLKKIKKTNKKTIITILHKFKKIRKVKKVSRKIHLKRIL